MKNKRILTLSFLAGSLLFASCLKDKVGDYWPDELAGKMYATVPAYTLQTLPLKPVADAVTYTFAVNIATDALPTEDITLTLATDPAAVTQYNTDRNKSYKAFPNVQVLTPSVVIAKGTRTGSVSFKVWGADALNACDNFMAAVSIMSATTASGKTITIAGNMKSCLLALPISNPYAADYRCYGYRKHPTLGTFPVDKTETLSTINCMTVRKLGMGDYPYYVDMQVTTNTITVNGATCYKVNVSVIDPATMDYVSSGYGMQATWAGDVASLPAKVSNEVNYYNPATKTFVLNYYYNSAAPRIAYEIVSRL